MMSGYSFLTSSSSHSFHDGEVGAAVWHMLLMSIDLGSQDDFSLTLVGCFFSQRESGLPNINSTVCLSSVYPVHIYLVPGMLYLQQTSPFYFWYLSFATYPFHSTSYLLPVCFSNWGVRHLACTNLSVLYPVPRVPKIFRLLSYPLAL